MKLLDKSVIENKGSFGRAIELGGEIRTELLRKSIHILIGLTPTLAFYIGQVTTMVILALGIVSYTIFEFLRIAGVNIPFISTVTKLASRQRDGNGFVLGPLTLGLGALMALTMYPEPASALAIYALAFGDGLASLFGKLFGTIRIPFSGGKSLEGSLACFIAVTIAGFSIFPNANPFTLMFIGIVATFLELLPTKDFDNVIIPIGTGLLAYIFL